MTIDTGPFAITPEFKDVLEQWFSWHAFIEVCERAFLVLRLHANVIAEFATLLLRPIFPDTVVVVLLFLLFYLLYLGCIFVCFVVIFVVLIVFHRILSHFVRLVEICCTFVVFLSYSVRVGSIFRWIL